MLVSLIEGTSFLIWRQAFKDFSDAIEGGEIPVYLTILRC